VCRDRIGDGTTGDLTGVRLQANGDSLTTQFAVDEPPPTKGTVLYSVVLWSLDGNTGYQLGVKLLNDRVIAHFIYDQVRFKQTNLTGEISTDGTKLTAQFPAQRMANLGDTFEWSATLNIAGADVDVCPRPGPDPLDPKQMTFPDVGS